MLRPLRLALLFGAIPAHGLPLRIASPSTELAGHGDRPSKLDNSTSGRVRRRSDKTYCAESVPVHPVQDLMREFERVDKALRAIDGGPAHLKFHKYAQYEGPWIENYWIKEFYSPRLTESPDEYAATFGPFVPVFGQWVDILRNDTGKYRDLMGALRRSLRHEEFVYITVSQCDLGLTVDNHYGVEPTMAELRGLVVLSSGGYGHVPLPLLKQPELPRKNTSLAERSGPRLGFAGSASKHHGDVRKRALEGLRSLGLPGGEFGTYHGPRWREFDRSCRYCLAPRGNGRSSFALYEIVQMEACVPVYVYDDVAWLPYTEPPSAGFQVHDWVISVRVDLIKQLPTLLNNVTPHEYMTLRRNLHQLRSSHFTYAGVMNQIRDFMTGPVTPQLKCRPLPASAH